MPAFLAQELGLDVDILVSEDFSYTIFKLTSDYKNSEIIIETQ